MAQRRLHQLTAGTALGLSAAGLVFLLGSLMRGLFADFEIATFDLRYRNAVSEPIPTIEEIVIVDIDSRSLHKLGRFQDWPRRYHAALVDTLASLGARAVFLDLLLIERDRDPQQDRQLVDSVRRAGNVYAALLFSQADTANFIYPMAEDPVAAVRPDVGLASAADLALPIAERVDAPFPELLAACAGAGAVNWGVAGDNAARRFPLVHRFLGRVYPTIGLRLAVDLLGVPLDSLRLDPAGGVELRGQSLPLIPSDEEGQLWLNYAGYWKSFRYLSYYDVLNGRIPPGFLAGKVVMVGTSAPGLSDLSATPFQHAFPRVELHATVLHNLLTGRFLRRAPTSALLAAWITGGLLAGLLAIALPPLRASLALLLLAGGYWVLADGLFAQCRLWLEVVRPIGSAVVSFGLVVFYRYWTEEREKVRIRTAFQHYVPPEVVEEVVRDPRYLRLSGQRRALSVLFSDIKGFTAVAERLDAEELARVMNDYLTTMTDAVFARRGTLDKYVGDMIMAIYGAPIAFEDHARAACETALDMLSNLTAVNDRHPSAQPLDIGIGVNTGSMWVGNMGSNIRFTYTVTGDAVNLASRLEGLTRHYRNRITIGEDTLNALGDGFVTRRLDRVRVKGKQRPVGIHELVGRRGEVVDPVLERLAAFASSQELYFGGNWSQALAAFDELHRGWPDDGPTAVFRERCIQLDRQPPPSGWDGVWAMEEK